MKAILVFPGSHLDYTLDMEALPRVGETIVYDNWVITNITHEPCYRLLSDLVERGFISNQHRNKRFSLVIWLSVQQ